jgi:parvulin-like peptidyl-prolyl isomerase
MMKKKMLCGALISVVLVTTVAAQIDLQPAAIVRLTKSEPTTVKQFRTTVEQAEKSVGRALTQTERRDVLDSLINQQLILQAAERDRVTVDSELNERMQYLRMQLEQNFGRAPTDAQFADAIRGQFGLELLAFREQLRKQLTIEKYIIEKKRTELQTSIRAPTEAEIGQSFALYKSELVRPETVRISMIQVPYGENIASRTRAKVLADRLLAEIGGSPAKFDETVQKSKAPNSGYEGGDAGYLPHNAQGLHIVGNTFLNIAFRLRQGEVSTLIEGIRGFQIIKVTESYEMKLLQLDDVMDFASGATVRAVLGNRILQERQQEVITKVTQEVSTELRRGNPFQIFENNLNW